MRRFIFILLSALLLISCVSTPTFESNETPISKKNKMPSDDRGVLIDGMVIVESDLGDIERWYAVDKYDSNSEVLFQVVRVLQLENTGYVLYGNGSIGTAAVFSRQGLNLRWDWGDNLEYSIVIHPDNTGYYYDFSSSKDGTANPSGFYTMYRF